MRRMNLVGMFFTILFSCQDPNHCQEQICITDARLVGEWEIFEECLCHFQGGDFVWRPVDEKYLWKFDSTCKITEIGAIQPNCNSGNYSIKNDTLSVRWICSNSSTTSAEYQFSVSQNGDTLTIKGFIDEGYIGQKFIKNK